LESQAVSPTSSDTRIEIPLFLLLFMLPSRMKWSRNWA
jgi:hypothetical protein